jgi:MraZ protein
MLIGEFRNKLVDGFRVAFPKKFRQEMGEKLILAQGYEGCLIAVSPKSWDLLISDAAAGPFVSQSVRDTTRFLLGSAAEVELDEQGRFVVPEGLREASGIKDEIAFLGLGRWVEVWDLAVWNDRKKYIKEHGSEIAERLSRIEL